MSRRTGYYERIKSTLIKQPSFHEKLFLDQVAAGFLWPLAYVLTLSLGVGVYFTYAKDRKDWLHVDDVNWNTPFSLISFALALLLVFRTNSSYARWWEGRIAWGRLVNFARNLSRQAISWFPEQDSDLLKHLLRWIIAAPFVAKSHLRERSTLQQDLTTILEPAELAWLLECGAKPSMVVQMMTEIVARANVDWEARRMMEDQIIVYENFVGAGERLLNTAIPAAYTRHTSRFLMLYLTLAPLLMWPGCGWATPFLAVFVAFMLVGTENIGAQIEEPFHVLPLDAYCTGIQRTVTELQAMVGGGRQLLPRRAKEQDGGDKNGHVPSKLPSGEQATHATTDIYADAKAGAPAMNGNGGHEQNGQATGHEDMQAQTSSTGNHPTGNHHSGTAVRQSSGKIGKRNGAEGASATAGGEARALHDWHQYHSSLLADEISWDHPVVHPAEASLKGRPGDGMQMALLETSDRGLGRMESSTGAGGSGATAATPNGSGMLAPPNVEAYRYNSADVIWEWGS